MASEKTLTNKEIDGYNRDEPIRCDCGKIVAIRQNGFIYVKCRACRRQVAIFDIRAENS